MTRETRERYEGGVIRDERAVRGWGDSRRESGTRVTEAAIDSRLQLHLLKTVLLQFQFLFVLDRHLRLVGEQMLQLHVLFPRPLVAVTRDDAQTWAVSHVVTSTMQMY